ncbi:bifunctional [glutamine synthetase] adenylyltransferase/[glutamine synthetase]-adenylyl-L-tyrosine phosphorylase [Phaeospirillum tilakii]|uniref:Bifunctional glutamine synthetase adenylyltransferase/adenylyl-removing enzyme n=1 Tax=Phaeospirillum tilakii TaxID=741673 RepID=A0ABW5C9K0_9PROT
MGFPVVSALLPRVADPFRLSLGRDRWRQAVSLFGESAQGLTELPDHPLYGRLLDGVFANSPFLTRCLEAEPPYVAWLLEVGPDEAFADLLEQLQAEIGTCDDPAALMKPLRVGKRFVALLTALADLSGAWTLEQVTGALSRYADTAIALTLDTLLRRAALKGDIVLPAGESPGRASGIVVLGMGKLGAHELNYSSDIDLIVFYDHEKIEYRGTKSVPEFMVALTRDLCRVLESHSGDGYVFRTDLRLRPDPGSTPAAVSIIAAETYYESFGQNWERAAMIKARQVAGDPDTGSAFLKFLRPFIWRKSLDFAAIADIHSIKRQINAHKGGRTIAVAGHNIKLGRGGIREIEFFAQTQQLIWGGRQPELRESGTVAALAALARAGHVAPAVAETLTEAYRELRRIEHRLQMIEDKQTQTLPNDPERLAQLAAFLGHPDVDSFSAALLATLHTVETHYAALFEDAPALAPRGDLVFTGGEDDPETLHTLGEMGFAHPAVLCETIRGWHHGRVRATRSTRARELLTELTPTLLAALADTAAPDQAFLRFDEFLRGLPAGVALFSLFHANPTLLDLVAEIMGDAPLLAAHLARHPVLLDAVLQAGFFAPPPGRDALAAELDRALDRADDFQQLLDLARRWTNDRKFQIGVLTLRGVIGPAEASRALSDLAEAVLATLAPRVEAEFAQAHGTVPGGAWVLLAMGKAGGREMSATSDLDLILVYDAPEDAEQSDGAKALAVPVWFARFTQRLINALSAKTGEGILYEVDMRLRPSGHSGPVASSLEAFRRYQAEAAWTWEHMALTRARVVAGDPGLTARVEAVRRDTLTRRRDPVALLRDVATMRDKIAQTHKPASGWDVKYRPGGLVDIEFIAQTLQLAHAADHPAILAANTAEALSRARSAGLLDDGDAQTLDEALALWGAVQTVLRQTLPAGFDESNAPPGLKSLLVSAAGVGDFKSLVDRMEECADAARAVFERLIVAPAGQTLPPTSEETAP